MTTAPRCTRPGNGIAYHELSGFTMEEVGRAAWERLWRRGGFPRSFLARTEKESVRWRNELIRTCLERDIPPPARDPTNDLNDVTRRAP